MDKLRYWKLKLEAAREYGLYFDYKAVEELLKLVEQHLSGKTPKYFDADDQH